MNVVIIGVSNIALRRVIPALASLNTVEKIHLASQRALSATLVPEDKRGLVFPGYERALAELGGGLAYISLPNSLHAPWVRRALAAGFHVVVDKPAGTTLREVEEMVELADRHQLCLAEATVWAYHPQFQHVQALLAAHREKITRVTATFSFPPLPPDNFRNRPQLGGGGLLDLGPYAASCGRHFFGESAQEVVGRVLTRDASTGLETSFSLLATYSGGRALVGHFGFNTEYRNTLSLLGSGIAVDIERAFTVPADLAPHLHWRRKNQAETLPCPAGDSFALFLHEVIEAIEKQAWHHWSEAMLQDAHFLNQLKTSAGVSNENQSMGLSGRV